MSTPSGLDEKGVARRERTAGGQAVTRRAGAEPGCTCTPSRGCDARKGHGHDDAKAARRPRSGDPPSVLAQRPRLRLRHPSTSAWRTPRPPVAAHGLLSGVAPTSTLTRPVAAWDARVVVRVRRLLVALGVAVACATSALAARTPCSTCAVEHAGVGTGGIYDPSLEQDGDRIWMSYTAVETPQTPACATPDQRSTIAHLETRLAASADRGTSWQDAGRVNEAVDVCLPAPDGLGTWVNEVSTLVRDAGAAPQERWKLFWHRYLWARDGDPANRRFQHGWLAMRSAASPDDLAAAPTQKLFAARGYDASNDVDGGPPLVRLHELAPELADCVAATEPGAAWLDGTLYLALTCHALDPAATRMVLLARAGGTWRYASTLFDAATSAAVGSPAVMTAPELFPRGRRLGLLATPVHDGLYRGCLSFDVDLVRGGVRRTRAGFPRVRRTIVLAQPTLTQGACGWDPRATRSGVLLGRVPPALPPVFEVLRTGMKP